MKRPETIHECGHALIFFYYGFQLGRVSIQTEPEERKNIAGIVQAHSPSGCSTDAFAAPANFTAGMCHALMAGRAAVEAFFPGLPFGGHGFDFESLENLILPDSETLRMHQWRTDHPDETVELFYQTFKKQLMKILKSPQGKRAVNALSRALEKSRILSGQEAAHILFEAWGDPPPPGALPVSRHMALSGKSPQCYPDLVRALRTYFALMLSDIKHMRDCCGTDEENEHLDNIVARISLIGEVL